MSEARLIQSGTPGERALLRAGAGEFPSIESVRSGVCLLMWALHHARFLRILGAWPALEVSSIEDGDGQS